MEIRKLEQSDIDEAYKLLNELYENGIVYDIFIRKYQKILTDNNFYGIVALENGIIVGILISRLIDRLVKPKDILFIDDLIVNKEYRGKGIGKLLLQNAIDYGKELDCQTIELKAYINNETAHKLYEKMGFEKQHFAFKKKL